MAKNKISRPFEVQVSSQEVAGSAKVIYNRHSRHKNFTLAATEVQVASKSCPDAAARTWRIVNTETNETHVWLGGTWVLDQA
jgi:hypothetical protein